MSSGRRSVRRGLLAGLAATAALAGSASAQAPEPAVLDRALVVRTAVSGLEQPVSIAFLARDDLFVLEKASGKVKRVRDGEATAVVLDLAVNSASERGLLGIALHPRFRRNGYVYLFWSESRTGADTSTLDGVRLLGNRLDRFRWNGRTLEFDRNIGRYRAYQADADQPLRGNHDGGVLRFGPDRKLYVIRGDTGRRGQMQNLADGPFGPGTPDDQFGGPEPDDAHFTGVIERLEDDGSAPRDNPFWAVGRAMGGEVGANVQRIYAYGVRNSFGMAFDPRSGDLWAQENGDDSYSELNRVEPGMNSGWVQIMGPAARVADFRAIETDPTAPQPHAPSGYSGLQQVRWLPTNIAETPQEALSRLVMLPGAHFSDPELAWRFEVAPGGIGFVTGRGLGGRYRGDLIVAGARNLLEGGHLFRIEIDGRRKTVDVDDPRLEDGVADNLHKWEITESESLLFGRDFGIGTDVVTGPDGNLYVVSLSKGSVYRIGHRRRTR